jgi:hypothetical protein
VFAVPEFFGDVSGHAVLYRISPKPEAKMSLPSDQRDPTPRAVITTTATRRPPPSPPSARTRCASPALPNLLEGYISDEELCQQLDITDRTSRKWRQTGEGPPFVKVGHGIYYSIDEFQRWLKKRTVDPRGR